MRIYNTETATHPAIVHAPGIVKWNHLKENPLWEPIHKKLFAEKPKEYRLPKYASIITWNSQKHKGVLELSLDRLGLPYLSIKKNPWEDFDKVVTTKKAIEDINAECIIWLDCFDTMILDDLSQTIDEFMNSSIGVCFNAEKRFWPNVFLAKEYKKFQENVQPQLSSKYLNAGACIAKKKPLKDAIELCIERRKKIIDVIERAPMKCAYSDNASSNKIAVRAMLTRSMKDMLKCKKSPTDRNSPGTMPDLLKRDDQIIFHSIFPEIYPDMQIDSACRFFQVIKYWHSPKLLLQ